MVTVYQPRQLICSGLGWANGIALNFGVILRYQKWTSVLSPKNPLPSGMGSVKAGRNETFTHVITPGRNETYTHVISPPRTETRTIAAVTETRTRWISPITEMRNVRISDPVTELGFWADRFIPAVTEQRTRWVPPVTEPQWAEVSPAVPEQGRWVAVRINLTR